MDTLADYTAWKAKQQETGVDAVNVVIGDVDAKPDEVAADLNLANDYAKTTGGPVPPAPMVKEFRVVFQQEVEREKNRTILASSPRLTEWLRNPENATVARDDLEGLSWWETPLHAAGNAFSRGVKRVPQSWNQFLASSSVERGQDKDRGFGDILSDETAIHDQAGGVIANKPSIGPQDLLAAGSRYLTSRLSELFGNDEKAAAAYYQQQVGLINKRIAETPLSPAGSAARDQWASVKPSGDVMTDLGNYMRVIGSNFGGFSAFVAETAAESLPTIAAATGVALATRSPAAGAVFMGASSAATEAGSAPADFFKEKGLDISTPEGAAKAVGDPAMMREAINRGNARAVVVGLMDGLSGGVAGKMLAQSPVGNMVLQGVTQALMGAAGEAGGQAASGQAFNLGDVLLEGLAEFAGAPVEVAGMSVGRLMQEARKAKSAADRKVLFEQLSGQAQTSVLRNRLPDKFRQFVEAATANGPVENVYVPADQFVQYFQGIGVDPHALADTLDGVTRDDLDAALSGGGDLQIPTATYAAKIAGSEHDAFLMENMRFDPDEFTATEAAEFNERAQDAMQEAYEVAERVRQDQEQYRSHEQEIYDTMVSRLREAGRSTDVATTEATLYPAFYRVMAERSGMAIDEFMQRYPLPQVRGDLPQGMQIKDVDSLTRTLAEARNRKAAGLDKRQTLLEFISEHGGINDVGGELKARDAEIVKRGKGKKNLKLARAGAGAAVRDMLGGDSGTKHSADEVARAAIEAGFMANDPVVHEYQEAIREGREIPDITRTFWDHIDRELGGEPVRAGEPDAATARAADLDQIEAYLNSLGVSIDDDDAAIRSAIEKDQAGGGREYGQAPAVESDAFKAWFGDSKVVDDEGKPLVVYHGSTADFDAFDPARANPESDLGGGFYFSSTSGDVDVNYAGEGPDLTNKLERERELIDQEVEDDPEAFGLEFNATDEQRAAAVDRVARERLGVQHGGATYPVYLSIKNPAVLGGDNPTFVESGVTYNTDRYMDEAREQIADENDGDVYEDMVLDRARELAQENGDDAIDGGVMGMIEAIRDMASDFDSVDADRLAEDLSEATFEGMNAADLIAAMKASEGLVYAADLERGDNATSEVVRRAFEAVGYDGFIDHTVDEKFGSQKRVGKQMEGMNADTVHYITFRPEQVKSVNNRGTFDPNDARLLFQSGPLSGPRGAIQFPSAGVGNGDTVIRMFEGANLSTLIHESGHYFLTVMQDMAARGEVGVSADLLAIRDWWRENAAEVAKDAKRVMPDVEVTADDVIAALENGTTGDVMKDGAIDVGMQEQWARGFEAYLMEGKAPSVELRSAFEKFRAWFISVYRRLAGLNVTISDDIRGVFDRMIATDDEIAKATAETGDVGATFTAADQLGLSPEQFDRLMKLRAQSEDEAKARLLRETMAPVKRAQEKWFKEERAKVRDEVSTRINSAPTYRAMEWMGNRRWFGDEQPADMPDMRLSKDILVERYGEGVLATLPRGKQTVYAVEGGLDPDEAAGWFGFGSGDEMIRAMERAPKRNEAIDAETDRVMRERHGDVLNDGEVEAAALDAVHNDKRGQWIAAELKAITDVAAAGKPMTAKEARASARGAIARMRVRDAMNANRFLAAERKAADEAARLGATLARDGVWLGQATARMEAKARAAAKGDATVDQVNAAIDRRNNQLESGDSTFTVPDRAVKTKAGEKVIAGGERTAHQAGYNENVARLIEAKRRQLLNHAFYMEARKVADEVEKAERFVNKLEKASHRERIAGAGRRENAQVDYLAAIDEILERYNFRRLSGRAEQRRGALNAYVAAMTAAGRENELAIPETVLADAARKPYKTMPVEEMRGVVDTLKNLEHTALRWDDLIDRENKRKLDEVVTDIVAAFDANVKKKPPSRVATGGERRRHAVRQFFDLVLNATMTLREIDGFDRGAAYRNIKGPIDEAMNRLIVRKEKAAHDLEALYSVYSKDERRKMSVRLHMPELGYALSKWERIAVALNTGNDGNLQRLTDPKVRGSLTPAQVQAVLATLDERDAGFVQSVWDYIGSFRPDLAARERRTTGVEPGWVEAAPIEIAGKTLTGGYYPIKYDARLSAAERDNQLSDMLQSGRFGKAQTRNGHLQARARSSGRAVELDMSVMHRHVNQVIYDLELSEAVANGWRILQDGRVRSSFIDAGKQADFDALEMWLLDTGVGEVKSGDIIGVSARMLKSNFTAAKLAFNLSTVLLQTTGVFQSAVIVGKKNMAVGIAKTVANPASVAADVAAKSPFMASRQTTFNKDIYDFYSDPQIGPVASRWGDIKANYIGPLSFWLMTKVQFYTADVPTWIAGYEQGLKKFGNDEAEAIAHADDVVKRAQASGLFSDRSAIERGSRARDKRQEEVVRLFTTLGSYMFAKFNVAYERSVVAGRVIADEGVSLKSAREALSLTIDMAFLFTLEALLGAAVKGQLPKGDDDDDGWLKFLAKQTGLSVMGTLPFIRDGASVAQGFDGGGAYGSAIGDAFKGIGGVVGVGSSFSTGEEVKKSHIKAIINGTGLAFGLPATQINRAVDAGWRQVDGEDVSPLEYILGRFKK